MRLVLIASLLAACTEDPPRNGPNVNSFVEYYDVLGRVPLNLDVLIVVDDSTAMASHQTALDTLPAALTAITESASFTPDLRIAVTTANGQGALRPTAAGSYLALSYDARLNRTPTFSGSLDDALGALLDVGAASSSTPQPLSSIKLALEGAPDFARDNGYLVLITIAAGDDASSMAVADYVSDLKAHKADPAQILAVGIYDLPATRLDAFHADFPNRNMTTQITGVDYPSALSLLSQINTTILGVPCVLEPADVDASTAGPQYDCALDAYYEDDTTEPIRQCEGATERCFEVMADPQICGEPGYGRFVVRGFPTRHTPAVRGQCVVAGGN